MCSVPYEINLNKQKWCQRIQTICLYESSWEWERVSRLRSVTIFFMFNGPVFKPLLLYNICELRCMVRSFRGIQTQQETRHDLQIYSHSTRTLSHGGRRSDICPNMINQGKDFVAVSRKRAYFIYLTGLWGDAGWQRVYWWGYFSCETLFYTRIWLPGYRIKG